MNRQVNAFFKQRQKQFRGVAYAQALVVPRYSEVGKDDVDVSSWFSRNIPLKCPIVSAAMDTVTDEVLAIAMAKFGGLGVIHANLPIDKRAAHVLHVKTTLSAKVSNPRCVPETELMEVVEKMRKTEDWKFHSALAVNQFGRLTGYLMKSHFMRFGGTRRKVRDVMIPINGNQCGHPGMTLHAAHKRLLETETNILPLIDKGGNVKGMYTLADVMEIMNASRDRFNVDRDGSLRVGAAIGTRNPIDEAVELVKAGVDVLVIDTSHGHTNYCVDAIRKVKRRFPETDLVAGNICTREAARLFATLGVDGEKIGIGPGAACKSREVGGIGVPQLYAVWDCRHEVDTMQLGEDAPKICADGGIEEPGHVVKAFVAGAHCAMVGGMLSGADEAPGKKVQHKGVWSKEYRGMASEEAILSGLGSQDRYDVKENVREKIVPEGTTKWVPCSGPARKTLFQLEGGVRLGMSHVGARTIRELQERGQFIEISEAGMEGSKRSSIGIEQNPN